MDVSDIHDPVEDADLEVFLDPQSGALLGQRPYATWLRIIHGLHEELLIPRPGQMIVAVVGYLLAISIIAGVMLWWRQSRRNIRRGLKISLSSAMPKLIRDVHTVGGIYIALFLFVSAISGALINTYLPINRWLVTTFDGSTPAPTLPKAAAPQGATQPQFSANQARDIAVAYHQPSEAVNIAFPLPQKNTYSIRLYPRDQSKTQHMVFLVINAATGRIQYVLDPDKASVSTRLGLVYKIWIHNGEFWGLAGRVLVLLTGLGLTTLFPTGLYIWWRQRKSRAPMK